MPKRIWAWLENPGRSGAIVALTAVAGVVVAVLQFAGPLLQGVEPPTQSIVVEGDNVVAGEGGDAVVVKDNATLVLALDQDRFAEMLDERLTQLKGELQTGNTQETSALRAQIAEVERQRNNLQAAFKARVEELRRLRLELKALAVNVPQDRLDAAQAALYQGDTKLADALFAEIEEAESEAVQRAAEAAYQRGKIAEDEVRWSDAAAHYARAATLAPDYNKLFAARELAWRAGDYRAAFRFGEQLLASVIAENQEGTSRHATALNEHAITLQYIGQPAAAEALFRQALEIDKTTIGEEHHFHATRLNNLADLLRESGKYEEAEELLRKAIEIGKATIGEEHPNYAIRLNNLAVLLKGLRRHEEAEALYRQALEIGERTIGTKHPSYAIRLNNLANLLRAMKRYDEAEGMFRQALEIDAATIGKTHPEYAKHLNNLAGLLRVMKRYEEAEPLYREALAVDEASVGKSHPNYANRLNNFAVFLEIVKRFDEAPELYREAVRISRTALGDDHPRTKLQARNFARFLRKHDPSSPDLPVLEAAFGPDIGR